MTTKRRSIPLKLKSLREVAELTGVPFNTVTGWRTAGWLPGGENEWSLPLMFKALAEQYGGTKTTENPDRLRKLSAEAEKLELQNERSRYEFEKRRGDWVSKAAVQLEVSEALVALREELSRIGPSMRSICPPELTESITRQADNIVGLALKAAHNRLLNLQSLESADAGEAVEC